MLPNAGRLSLKKAWSLSLALYALGVPLLGLQNFAWGNTKLHPHQDTFKAARGEQMAIIRYAGQPNFNSQSSIIWDKQGDKYVASNKLNHRHVVSDVSACEKLFPDNMPFGDRHSPFVEQQRFSMEKMVSTDYIDAASAIKFLDRSLQFRPTQATMIIKSRMISDADATRMYGPNYSDVHVNHLAETDIPGSARPIISATMWSIAAQELNPRTRKYDHLPMHWQKDPARAELARNFDRTIYQYVWEWGRTAQELPGEAEPLAAALAAINYQELLNYGGDLKHAYVMFHSYDERNTKAYSMRFPRCIYPPDHTDVNDTLFLVPLAKVLEAFPASRHSKKVADLMKYSDGRLDELGALRLLQKMHAITLTQLDVLRRDGTYSPYPLVVQDWSIGAAYRRGQIAESMGLHYSQQFPKLQKTIAELVPGEPPPNSGQYPDISDTQFTRPFFIAPNQALEISNLDVEVALKDEVYVERMLMATLAHYIGKLLPPDKRDQAHAQQAIDFLHQRNFRLAISTYNLYLKSRIEQLHPVKSEVFRSHQFDPTMPEMNWVSSHSVPLHSYLFTVEQIVAIAQALPKVYDQAFHMLKENVWAKYLSLSNPDVW